MWGREESKEHEGKDEANGMNWRRERTFWGENRKTGMQMRINLLINMHT